ncbi:MAG: PA2778 family cysteine peptidase [Deltaproteobacteria bacterium]|nr:PA2778 family cysteine peptidase [Deltaproteobacteria bacterium]
MPVPAIRCGKTGITFLILFLTLMFGCAHFSHELNSLSVSELPGNVEIPSVPFYPQEAYQCGPAAMAMVLQWTKVNVSPQDLIPKVFVPAKKGSLQPALISAARRYNRLAYPIKGVEALVKELAAGHPAIILQNLGLKWFPRWHYSVPIGYNLAKSIVILHSGKEARRRMSWTLFMRTWKRADYWGLVVLPSGQLPTSADEQSYLRAVLGLEQARQFKGAAAAYTAALERWHSSLGALMGLGNCHYALGDLIGAEQAFRHAAEAHPQSGASFNNLAHVLAEQGRYAEALQMAIRAVDIGGANKPLYLRTLQEIRTIVKTGPE